MLSKQQIKFIQSLHLKKFRKSDKLFIVEGEKCVSDLLHSDWKIQMLLATDSISDEIRLLISIKYKSELIVVSQAEMNKISPQNSPQGVLAIVHQQENYFEIAEVSNELVLVLDDIQDPGNAGTIIRIADWFGIRHVICSMQTAECYNPKVVQSSMGSLFRISMYYMDLQKLFQSNSDLTKIPVIGAVMSGGNIYSSDLPLSAFIVFGNESAGISQSTSRWITKAISIPAYNSLPGTGADSLNVAIAAGIICAEFRRRSA